MIVDVVIPTWNGLELLIKCLEHLERVGTENRPVIVDNGSTDGTAETILRRFPQSKVIVLPENLGFGSAVNRGFEICTSEIVVLINNDTMVQPGFLEKILEPFANERVGMVAGMLIDPRTGLIDAAGTELDEGLGGYLRLSGHPPEAVVSVAADPLGPSGAAAAYRRRAFDEVGGFDEQLFVFCEDDELAMRLAVRGWLFAMAEDAVAMHQRSSTFGVRGAKTAGLYAESRGYVAGRYRIPLRWLLFEAVVGSADSVRLRSAAPITNRVRGWRRGRSLPARSAPGGRKLTMRDALRRRRT